MGVTPNRGGVIPLNILDICQSRLRLYRAAVNLPLDTICSYCLAHDVDRTAIRSR